MASRVGVNFNIEGEFFDPSLISHNQEIEPTNSSVKFEKTHQDYPITRSMSRAGTPTDNPVIESLIGWIKGDLKHYLKLHDFGDINKAIEIFVDYFYHHRVAYRLDYMTPVEYRMIKGFN